MKELLVHFNVKNRGIDLLERANCIKARGVVITFDFLENLSDIAPPIPTHLDYRAAAVSC